MSSSSTPGGDVRQLLEIARKRHEAGQLAEAEQGYRQVLAIKPEDPDAWHLRGVVALQLGQFQQAIEHISRALNLRAEFPEALNNLGSVMLAMGNVEQAEKLIRLALKFKPDYADALGNLGALLNTLERPKEAVDVLRQAIKSNPRAALAYNNLGNALRDLGQLEEAEQSYRRALRLDSDNPGYAAASGGVLMQRGEHDEAMGLFKQALSRDPLCVPALCGLAVSKKIGPNDPEVALFQKAAARVRSLGFRDQVEFMFAWGKLHDDIGDYANAFKCLAEANRLRRTQRHYSRAEEDQALGAIIEAYTPARMESLNEAGLSTELPVFVVGMPRSGTTLTEQIISSHPRVFGAGELKVLGRLVREGFGLERGSDMREAVQGLTVQTVNAFAGRYLAQLRALDMGAARITDKMPANFWHIGLIRLMFPNARVIHVRRNPVDTLLSCFQQNFGEGQAFSNDLADAGHYYGLYRRVMQHWHELLPGFVLDVDYECLVSDPEVESRRLIEFVGLDWDDACLRPSENRRAVRTASQWQVRQPVHTGSIARWRRYEQELQPLLASLREQGIALH